MSYQIHISSAAERNFSNVSDYIEFLLKNLKATDALLDENGKQMSTLSDYPETFILIENPAWGIRFIIVKNYLKFYTIDYENMLVIIVRFLYQESVWNAILHKGISLA